MKYVACVHAKLAHSTLDKLKVWSAASVGCVGELNPAYCVKCPLHCNILYKKQISEEAVN